MREAIQLARDGMTAGQGGPFGAVIVKNGQIVGRDRHKFFKARSILMRLGRVSTISSSDKR